MEQPFVACSSDVAAAGTAATGQGRLSNIDCMSDCALIAVQLPLERSKT